MTTAPTKGDPGLQGSSNLNGPALVFRQVGLNVVGLTDGVTMGFDVVGMKLGGFVGGTVGVKLFARASSVTDVGLEVGVNVGSTVLGSDVVGLDDGDEVGVDVTGFKVGGIVG